jgi:hypothetical protein
VFEVQRVGPVCDFPGHKPSFKLGQNFRSKAVVTKTWKRAKAEPDFRVSGPVGNRSTCSENGLGLVYLLTGLEIHLRQFKSCKSQFP